MATIRKKTHTFATLIGVKTLLSALYEKPLTRTQLAEVTGLDIGTVSRWLKRLHVRPSVVYIESYIRTADRGNYTAVWAAGYNVPDALKPAALTSAQYNKRWRARQKKQSLTTNPKPGVIRHVSY